MMKTSLTGDEMASEIIRNEFFASIGIVPVRAAEYLEAEYRLQSGEIIIVRYGIDQSSPFAAGPIVDWLKEGF